VTATYEATGGRVAARLDKSLPSIGFLVVASGL